jgi:hypothetical protein
MSLTVRWISIWPLRPVLRKTNNIFIVLFALGTILTVVGTYLEKRI